MSYTFQTIFHLVISSEFHVRSTVLTTDIVESSLDYKREEGREKKKKEKIETNALQFVKNEQ